MYKIIQNNKIIDVVKIPRFVSFLASGHIAITNKISAQGIVGSDNKTIYSFIPGVKQAKAVVTIKEITLEEFNRLHSLLNSNQDISADETALELAKNKVIKRLSDICTNKITAGFDIKLSDGIVYNFKLTVEDQLNLMSIENQLNSGEETFIYHATGQPCKIYVKDDMNTIIKAFRRHILFHTTYFNAAKQYIKSLVDISKINLFTYGTDVSDTVEDIILKQILKNGGSIYES